MYYDPIPPRSAGTARVKYVPAGPLAPRQIDPEPTQTLTNEALLALAAKYPPPESWRTSDDYKPW